MLGNARCSGNDYRRSHTRFLRGDGRDETKIDRGKKMNPKKRLDELTDMLNRYAKKYYTEDISEVSDYEYDILWDN